ncbi:unnamed protein product, partial [Linum tenue]
MMIRALNPHHLGEEEKKTIIYHYYCCYEVSLPRVCLLLCIQTLRTFRRTPVSAQNRSTAPSSCFWIRHPILSENLLIISFCSAVNFVLNLFLPLLLLFAPPPPPLLLGFDTSSSSLLQRPMRRRCGPVEVRRRWAGAAVVVRRELGRRRRMLLVRLRNHRFPSSIGCFL